MADLEDFQQKLNDLRRTITDMKSSRLTRHLEGDDDTSDVTFKAAKELQGHFGKIYAMHWAQDSQHLCSASQDGKLMIWDGYTTNKRHMINLRSSWVMTCAYAPSGSFVACGGLDNLCSVYPVNFENAETHERPKHELSRHDGYLSCCRFIDDTNLITSSGDGTVLLWDIASATVMQAFSGHIADVMSISVSDSDNVFVSGSCDQSSIIWDSRQKPEPVQIFEGHTSDINSVQWFPNYKSFGSGSDDSTIRLFDIRAYAQLNQYSNDTIRCGVTSIDFSKSGKFTFAGYDDDPYCACWSTIGSKVVQAMDDQTARVSCLGVPKSGYCLCTGSWDNNLHIWTASKA